ncbi:hypothetical protein QTP70_032906, partial [Hemibagrus guttatus]
MTATPSPIITWYPSLALSLSCLNVPAPLSHPPKPPLYIPFLYTMASAQISVCLEDISSWMTAHQLKLNPSKTELLVIPAKNGPAPSGLKALVTPRTAPRLLRSTSTARLVPSSLREK